MSSDKVRLRGNAKRRREEFPLGSIPEEIILKIAKQFVHRLSIGNTDITGDDFGTIFANSIDGHHRESPLGIADVIKDNCAWSVKTIKDKKPFSKSKIRLISGRNSPDYSLGISDPRVNSARTGEAVIQIWNERVNEALDQFNDLRVLILVRNFETKQFVLFEEEATRFSHNDFRWEFNKNGNLIGTDIIHDKHCFTWQPHGSQFTIHKNIPAHAKKFSIDHEVPQVSFEDVIESIGYSDDWISIE